MKGKRKKAGGSAGPKRGKDGLKRVLIVDDEEDVVWTLRKNLKTESLEVDVVTAESGEEALTILNREPVDLLITDVRMPGMSGLDLLVQAREIQPAIGVIVMTAYHAAEVRRDAAAQGCLQFIEKPFDMNELRKTVRKALEKDKGFEGTLSGLELTDVIQLNCLSRSTSGLRIKTASKEGILFFKDGRVVHAMYENMEGEEAFYQILGFEGGVLESLKKAEPPAVTIESEYQELLMEGMRRLDEDGRGTREEIPDDGLFFEDGPPEGQGDGEGFPFEQCVGELCGIPGYRAFGVMTSQGRFLAVNSARAEENLPSVGMAFQRIFVRASDALRKIGFETCTETVIHTPRGIIVTSYLGGRDDREIHTVGVLDAQGNEALFRLKLEKVGNVIRHALELG